MKGTFAVLDIGGGSTKLHLWMQGRNHPVGGAVMMTGASTALLSALRANPDMLHADFADCQDDSLLTDVDTLCDQLRLAGENLAQADKALLMLDALLDEHKQTIIQHLYARFTAQRPTYMQAVLLEMYAAAIFNVGLMLESAADNTSISHLFPGDLTICLTGRGAWLLDTLTPQMRNGLQRIGHVPMQLRHPVRTLTVRPSALPALGVALGMTALKNFDSPAELPFIRTQRSFSELMQTLLLSLWQCYPLHAWLLHPELFDPMGQLTAAGIDTIRRIASQCYNDGEDIPASVFQFMDVLRRTPLASDPIPLNE